MIQPVPASSFLISVRRAIVPPVVFAVAFSYTAPQHAIKIVLQGMTFESAGGGLSFGRFCGRGCRGRRCLETLPRLDSKFGDGGTRGLASSGESISGEGTATAWRGEHGKLSSGFNSGDECCSDRACTASLSWWYTSLRKCPMSSFVKPDVSLTHSMFPGQCPSKESPSEGAKSGDAFDLTSIGKPPPACLCAVTGYTAAPEGFPAKASSECVESNASPPGFPQ